MAGRIRGNGGSADRNSAFDAARLRLDDAPPSPLPRRLLYTLLTLLVVLAIGLLAGKLDVVVVAEGRLVPRTLLKIVQPADAGVVREILVEEGMAIEAGQPVLRLDARLADADLRAHRTELAQRLLQVRRLDAELTGRRLEREAADPEALFLGAAAQLGANRGAHADAVAQANAQVARIGQELSAAIEVQEKLSQTVPIAQTMAIRFDRLRAEGFVSELSALERERERIEREHDLRSQRHAVRALHASLDHAMQQRAHVISNHQRQLHADRVEATAHVARLREEVDKQVVRREHIELASPQAGVVKELAIRSSGTVVGAGTVLVTIVPAGDALEAEVNVRNEDAGFVRSGQRAQLKVAAFPFQKYGLIEAEVLRIGPDATEAGAARSPGEDAAMPGGYRVRLALFSQRMHYEGSDLPLIPGMAASAEIHLGRRTVVDYLLAPVRKAWHEAGRER